MPSRRSLLVAAVAVAGSGCSSRGGSDVDPAGHVPDDWHEEPERGLADPITVDASILSQKPKNDCPYLAAETGAEALEDRLGDPESVYVGGCCREVDGHDRTTVWEQHVMVNREDEVVSSPTIEFQAVREAAPRTIEAPDESDHDCRLPVYVADVMFQED